jgi:hypothetical protein
LVAVIAVVVVAAEPTLHVYVIADVVPAPSVADNAAV